MTIPKYFSGWRKEHLSHSGFLHKESPLTIWLLIWTWMAALVPNVWLSLVDGLPILPALTNIILPAGVYLLLLSISRKIGVASLWFVILYVFAAFQLVLLSMYGRSIIAVDMFLNVVTTNSNEIGELLGNMKRILAIISIIYLPPIIMAVIAVTRKIYFSREELAGVRMMAVLTTVVGGIMLVGCYTLEERKYSIHCDLYPVNIGYNLREAVVRTKKVSRYKDNVKDLSYPSASTHPDSIAETYVLVIGETSRAGNWQINGYDRPTSPRLMDVEGLVNYPKALTQSNTTHKSVPMLLSHLNAESFGDSIYHTKSLISEFKNAGFHTAFFTAQSRNHSFIDFFGEEADTCLFIRETLDPETPFYDTGLLDYLDNMLASGHKKQLIVLHTYGSHFNYIDRYPQEKRVFAPDGPAEGTPDYRDKQINAYDNTILLTSNLLADIIERLAGREGISAMLYTSDHGEDIFDDSRKLFLHASPKPSYYQIHVPFMVWANDGYVSRYGDKFEALKKNSGELVASSDALYHTLTDMAGIETPYLRNHSSLASTLYFPMDQVYINDHNKSVPLSQSGLLHEDFVKLDTIMAKPKPSRPVDLSLEELLLYDAWFRSDSRSKLRPR